MIKIKVIKYFISMILVMAVFVTKTHSAQSSLQLNNDQYDYTYIVEKFAPEIGENGVIEYDKKWKLLLNDGWRLHSISNTIWVFERKRNKVKN